MNPLEDDESLSRRGFLVGTAGAAATVGASATGLAQEDNESEGGDGGGGGGNESDGGDGGGGNESEGGDGGGGGGGTAEVTVGPGGSPEFDPAELPVTPGTTVVWTWDSDNHNIHPDEDLPEEWEGHLDTEDSGFEYEHTFETEGEYGYVCDPHVGQGMTGTIIVDPNADEMGGGGGPQQVIPDGAWTLIIATTAGMVSVLSMAYAFLRYGGPSGE